MERTKSGSGMLQLSTQCRAGAASFLSPAGALASDHAARVEISAALSEGSFANWPIRGSANHGGMVFCSTAQRIAPEKGHACSYDSNGMGAIEPGRWQLWQCCSRMGRTSRENGGGRRRLAAPANFGTANLGRASLGPPRERRAWARRFGTAAGGLGALRFKLDAARVYGTPSGTDTD